MSEINKNTYNLVAKNYEDYHSSRIIWQNELEEFSKLLLDSPVILDLGCGPGRETVWLAENIAESELTGVDFSENMIALANENSAQNAAFIVEDITTYIPPKQVDGIWARGALHHLTDSEITSTFNNAATYLKPGAIICTINKYGDHEEVQHDERYGSTVDRYFNLFNEAKIEDIAREHDLDILSQSVRNSDIEWLISFLKVK